MLLKSGQQKLHHQLAKNGIDASGDHTVKLVTVTSAARSTMLPPCTPYRTAITLARSRRNCSLGCGSPAHAAVTLQMSNVSRHALISHALIYLQDIFKSLTAPYHVHNHSL
jgi:hypothetical protein